MHEPVTSQSDDAIRVAFILPGLHRVFRGAELAFESVGRELSAIPGFSVTLIGSGNARPNDRYRFIHSPCTPRESFENWPRFPPFRNEYSWEEATFAARMGNRYDPSEYDATVTCSYPFLNWLVRLRGIGRHRPCNVFVTQNGDWPVQAKNSEFRWFGCDALVCTNPVYFARHRDGRPAWLIPNAVDPQPFQSATPDRRAWGLQPSDTVVLMVSALISSKRVLEGIRAVAPLRDVHLVVAGDGPLREQIDAEGEALMGPRFHRVMVSFDQMPALYRSGDVLLHMCEGEPFGNIYVEALAAGLPVVTHDWSSTRWLFEDNAILVDTGDAEKVREGLMLALQCRSPQESQRRLELVNRRFTWKAVAGEYGRCLKTILEKRRLG
jgi:glycosyltransferase involved in cell wall biosynthesis